METQRGLPTVAREDHAGWGGSRGRMQKTEDLGEKKEKFQVLRGRIGNLRRGHLSTLTIVVGWIVFPIKDLLEP